MIKSKKEKKDVSSIWMDWVGRCWNIWLQVLITKKLEKQF